MTKWFTADLHFDHKNMLLFYPETRGLFKNVDELGEYMVEMWNTHVEKSDEVYYLGDFTLGDWKTAQKWWIRLNGTIYAIYDKTTHDKHWVKQAVSHPMFSRNGLVIPIPPIHEIKIDHFRIMLSHYPLEHWTWGIHLHGHSHGKSRIIQGRLDVGVDTCGFKPWSWEMIRGYFENYIKENLK
jgi:calcineurin-like phosphoesterase family protein